MDRCYHLIWTLIALACLPIGTGAYGQTQITPGASGIKSSWKCLPNETIVAVRIPNGQAIYQALAKRTKLGATLLDTQRIDVLKQLLKQADPARFEQTTKELERFGFALEDIPKILSGETGFALVQAKRDAKAQSRYRKDPVSVGLFWINPNKDKAQKLIFAANSALMLLPAVMPNILRVDQVIAGQRVIRLSVPVMGRPGMPEIPDAIYQLPIAEQNALIGQLHLQYPVKQVDQIHWFVTSIGDRILVGATYPQNQAYAEQAYRGGKKPDFAKITGITEATRVFSEFLTAHRGADSTLAKNVLSQTGVSDALPKGLPVLDILASPNAWLRSMETTDPSMAVFYKAGGVDQFDSLVGRLSLDGSTLRLNLFGHTPKPKTGVLALVGNHPLSAETPDWLPKDVLAFQQYGLDLGPIYKTARHSIQTGGLPETAPLFEFAENLILTLGSDLPTFLSSVGTRHSHMIFLPQIEKAETTSATLKQVANPFEQPDPNAVPKAAAASTGKTTRKSFADKAAALADLRHAAVWKLENPKAVETVFYNYSEQNGALRKVQIDGFVGFRAEESGLADIFVGKGYLVIAMGDGVIEQVLGALTDPAKAKGLGDGQAYINARTLLKNRKNSAYIFADMNRMFSLLVSAFADPLTSQLRMSVGQSGTSIGELITKLLPQPKELQGVFGPTVGQLSVNENGVVFESVIELKAP
jgi:hypothetical protein